MESPKPKHERRSFFKYLTASTTELVLSNRPLRWSSPLLFNDPFDVPREMAPNVNPQELVAGVAKRFAALIEQPPVDTSLYSVKLQSILETVKKGIPEHVKEELLANLYGGVRLSVPTSESLEALRVMWRNSIPDMRILCLAESPSHVAMWYHYAGGYTGVVLEFECIAALDSAWLAAQPVGYPLAKPGIYTVDGWAELLLLKPEASTKKMLEVSTYTKSPDWSYEREWRIVTFKRPGDSGLFTDYRFDSRELTAIYLGPLIKPSDRTKLVALASQYPNAKTFCVSLGASRDLLFEEVR